MFSIACIFVACAHRRTPALDTAAFDGHARQCFRGEGSLFVTPGARLRTPGLYVADTVRSWLTLLPAVRTDSSWGRARIRLGGIDRTYSATWRWVGDSLQVRQQSFPAPDWMFHAKSDLLEGRAHFIPDSFRNPNDPVDFPAQIIRVSCAEVPASS